MSAAPGAFSRETAPFSPAGREVQCLHELLRVGVQHVKILPCQECGDSRLSRRHRDRGRADCPLCAITERVVDEQRVAPDSLNRRTAQPALALPGRQRAVYHREGLGVRFRTEESV